MSEKIIASKYCYSVFDGTHDTPKPVTAGYPLVTSKHIIGKKLDLLTPYNISEIDYKNIQKRSQVNQWDVLFSMIGSVGEVYIEKNIIIPYAIKNIGVFSCKDELKAKWLYYYLQSPPAKSHIERYLNGAVQKFIPLGGLRNFPVIPFREDSKEIVKLLSTLDEKIELNNRINAELEALAKTLYDYWFVQFDFPDKNGKPYKSSGGKMVWNEQLKREIPEGWEVKNIDDISEVKAGGDKPEEFSDHKNDYCNIPVYANGIINDGLYGFTNEAKILKKSITISARGTIGYTVLRNKPFFPIIRLIVITPTNLLYTNYIYEFINSYGFGKSGSVQQQLTSPMVSDIKIICPAEDLIEKYHLFASKISDKIEILKEENLKLSEVRDFLLPMLMNGQITVGDSK